MYAVIFEAVPEPDRRQDYLDIAARLRPELEKIDGFLSIERFESLTQPGKILSLSFWRDDAAVARAELNTRQLQQAIHAAAKPDQALPSRVEEAVVTHGSKATGAGSGILIVGVDRLMTGLARCCKPAPPDAIVGFVTRGKGITIHRQSCSNVARMKEKQPERLISADWGTPRDEVFPVDVVVEAMDRQALLRDISEVFSREKINVTAVNTLSRNLQARMSFTIEVKSLAQLKAALAMVQDVSGVLSAGRR